jgi:antirestriction protein ArdC
MPSQNEIRQTVTNRILDALQNGNLPPWRRPWSSDPNCGAPRNVLTHRFYKGINVLLLMLASTENEYHSRWWGTFRQIKEMGGYVRRGQKATQIILYKPITNTVTTDDGEETEKTFPLMRTFCVFNVQQTVGLEHLHAGQGSIDSSEVEERFERAEEVIGATNATIKYGGNSAYYNHRDDYIQMPHRHQFAIPEFYETVAHELIHWTEHETRLNWDRKAEGYAMGELVAEIGGCFMVSELGLPSADELENHASYMADWLKSMENDPKFIFKAAAQANKAVDCLLSFSRTPAETLEPALSE